MNINNQTIKKSKTSNNSKRSSAWIAIALVCIMFLSSCRSNTVPEILKYDDYGKKIALNIAENYPKRSAGSESEAAVAELIRKEFETLGYDVESQAVELESGNNSQNLIVKIPGKGFIASKGVDAEMDFSIYERRAKEEYGLFRRKVIVAARYDSNPDAPEENDGISDNASGIGALLTLAKELKEYTMGYDIELVALGGGFANNAGSRKLLADKSAEEIKNIDAFYEFRSLYGGDKLYAHSGWSSTYPNQKYKLRQPAYQLAETAFNESVSYYTGIILYQNQISLQIDNMLLNSEAPEGFGKAPEKIVFREMSKNESDYREFDKLGVPVVYLESYNYSGESMDDIVENRNPNFASTNYLVRGTEFDNIETLGNYSEEDLLQSRINASAFMVLKSIETGVIGSNTEY